MSMETTTTTTSRLELPQVPTLESVLRRVRAMAQDDWVPSIMYGRASQDRKKLMRSIDDQLVECVGWCPPIRWNPVVIVRDSDRSASQWRTKEREGFDEAMALIESGKYGGFASWEPSRAARDLEVFVQLRKACRKAGVLYLTHGRVYDLSRSDDSFSMGFEFLRAEADADTMRERQLRTVRLNAQKGRPHGRLPFGYRRVYDEHTGELLRQEPDPVTGPLVQEMARRVLAGESMHRVAMSMQDRGVPAPHRPRSDVPFGWETRTVRQILRNPTMAGKRVYQGEVIGDAQWEPLISWEEHQRLQRVMADPGRRWKGGGGTAAKTLMTHIARCHYCGRPLKRAVYRRKNKADATKYYCGFRGCYKITISQPGLDAYVEEAVLAWFENPVNLARLTSGEDGGAEWLDAARAAEQRRRELQTRLDEAIGQYAEGKLRLDTLTKVESNLKAQIADAEREMVPPITDERIRRLITAPDVRAAWAELPLEERRKIIKAGFDVRIQQTTNRGQNVFETERVLMEPRACYTD